MGPKWPVDRRVVACCQVTSGPCSSETITAAGVETFAPAGTSDADLELDTVDSSLFGRLWAPGSLAEYTALIQHLAADQVGGWRGQANAAWTLDSSAVRRLRNMPQGWLADDTAVTESILRTYEERLIEKARLAGHGDTDRTLTDLELLAKLQHHGAATRLLDFTDNAFVALWFACDVLPKEWGMVFGINLDGAAALKTKATLNKLLASVLDDLQGRIGYWHPSPLSPRMPAQAGFLAWSKVEDCAWGSFGSHTMTRVRTPSTSQVGDELFAIAISPDLKAYMQDMDRWDSALGLNEERLFPDFDGFANANGAAQPLQPWYFGV